jgi:hypothetical protein
MIIRTIEIDTEEHAKEFDEILGKLPYVKRVKVINEIDLALGRVNATSAELSAFFTEDEDDKILIAAEEVFAKYKK